jgi:parallel beta-helix repeat protein
MNSGISWTQAWRTLKHAGRQAVAGDEVVIRKGRSPYGYLQIRNSGQHSKPIIFRGEDGSNPPVISGGRRIIVWSGPDEHGVWKSINQPQTSQIMEDGSLAAQASNPQCSDGRWYWDNDRTLYYKPQSGPPYNHDIWAAGGGGIIIDHQSWIVLEDIHAWFALGAGLSIKGGHHNIVRRFHAKWHWQGVHISAGAHHNLIEDCTVEWNREGIYIMRGAHENVIRSCRAFYNGNAPYWNNGDRSGIAIGEKGPSPGNRIEGCDIAFNGSAYSDPALIAYDAPGTTLEHNQVHDNFGSGIFVTIGSNNSRVLSNVVRGNGLRAVSAGNKGISGLSVRSSHDVLVEGNQIMDNHVSYGSRWTGKGLTPKGGLDLQGLPGENMANIVFRNNHVSGTKGGPDVYISPAPRTTNLTIVPVMQAPWWLRRHNPPPLASPPAHETAR